MYAVWLMFYEGIHEIRKEDTYWEGRKSRLWTDADESCAAVHMDLLGHRALQLYRGFMSETSSCPVYLTVSCFQMSLGAPGRVTD